MSARGLLVRVLLVAFAVALLAGAAVAVRDQDWSSVGRLARDTRPGWFGLALAAALLASSVGLLLGLLSWQAVLLDIGGHVDRWASARIFFVAFLSKFLPGKFWAVPAIVRMGRTEHVPPLRMAAVLLLNWVVTMLTGLSVGAAAGPAILGGRAWWLLLAVVPLLIVVARPSLVNTLARTVARVVRRPSPQRVSDRATRRAILTQAAAWVISGHHVWLLAVAAGAPPGRSYLLSVAGFGLAAAGGILVVVVPDGVGVREAFLVLALAPVLPVPVAGMVAVASRLVCTLSEVAVGGGGLVAAHIAVRRSRLSAQEVPA